MRAFLNRLLGRPSADGKKIVGLMLARNEAPRIRYSLKALSMHTDAIVFLDDCSFDDTLALVESCREECRVERILVNHTWNRDEPLDRTKLLMAGREIGGTHFIALDADEILTANFLRGGFLRDRILGLKPGEHMTLRWIHLWRGPQRYRLDGERGETRFKAFVFCDEGKAVYPSGHITHTPRVPLPRGKRGAKLKGPYGVLHFSHVNWENLELKLRWYQWMERYYYPEKSAASLIEGYGRGAGESGLVTEPCPEDWFDAYPPLERAFFDEPEHWRIRQIEGWKAEKGAEYFAGLQ